MKRFIVFAFLLWSFAASAQNYSAPGIPPGTNSFSPTFRYKPATPDSLAQIWQSIGGNKWYRMMIGTTDVLVAKATDFEGAGTTSDKFGLRDTVLKTNWVIRYGIQVGNLLDTTRYYFQANRSLSSTPFVARWGVTALDGGGPIMYDPAVGNGIIFGRSRNWPSITFDGVTTYPIATTFLPAVTGVVDSFVVVKNGVFGYQAGGGSGTDSTLYKTDGTLRGDRTVTQNSHLLQFISGGASNYTKFWPSGDVGINVSDVQADNGYGIYSTNSGSSGFAQIGGLFIDPDGVSHVGGLAYSFRTNTSNYSVLVQDTYMQGDATGGAFAYTLPDISLMAGSGNTYTFKKVDASANAITITPQSGQTIDGASSFVLSNENDFVTVISDNTNWKVISKNGSSATGTVTSITPGIGFTSHTPITTSGTMDVDTVSTIATKYYASTIVGPDGVVTGMSPVTVSGTTATVPAGTYRLNNALITKGSSTNVTIDAQDATLDRIDLIVGDASGVLTKVSGSLAATPAQPDVPSNKALISWVYIPATGGTVTTGGGGSAKGTVTTVKGVNANGFTFSIANPTTTPTITLTLQNATALQSGQLTSTDWSTFNGKQATLVSGTNIKTINGNNILGSGDVTISGGITNPMTTTGDMIYSSSGSTPARLVIGGAHTVIHGGSTPSYSSIDLTSDVTGILPNSNTTSTSAATASTIVSRDVNSNATINNLIENYTTTATAAGNTILTVSSAYQQYFTGTSTQAVILPVVSTLVLGQQYQIVNNSTGVVTVYASDGASIVTTLAGNTSIVATCISTSGTTAASWSTQNGGAGAVAGLSTYVQYNTSGAFGGSSRFTFNPSTFQLYLKGPNYASMILDAPTYSNLNLQSNGTTYGYIGAGQSSNLTGATDLSIKGTGNVSIEGSNVYLYGILHVPNIVNFGSSSASSLSTNIFGSGAAGSADIAFNWNNNANVGQIGNSDGVITSANNTGDLTFTTNKNIEFATGSASPTQSNISGQIFQTTGNWVFKRGGTFTDNGSTIQTQSFSAAITTTNKTATYTATTTDHTITGDATSAGFTITLPTAVGCAGREYIVKKVDSSGNAVTVATTSSQTIDASTTYSLGAQYKYVTVVSNGSNWLIISNN